MRYSYLLFLLLLAVAYTGRAQSRPSDQALEARYDQFNAYQVKKYRPARGYQLLVLRSDFSTEELADLRLAGKQLVRVDLVYTAFRRDPTFSQRQLNLGRLRNLTARLPGILHNPALTWNVVEQTGCTSVEGCQDFFHGFVLYLEKRYTAADTRREADSLLALLDTRTRRFDKLRADRRNAGRPLACGYPPSRYPGTTMTRNLRRAYRCAADKQAHTVRFRAEANALGQVERVTLQADSALRCPDELTRLLGEHLAFTNGFQVGAQRFPFAVEGVLRLPIRKRSLSYSGYYIADSLVKKHRIRFSSDKCVARLLRPEELLEKEAPIVDPDAAIVSKVIGRHPEWRKQVVVADVTGSMTPYTLDLLTWLQLSALKEPKTFVFFNDGNDAPDGQKPIGRTGGLYAVTTADFALIKDKVREAMQAGGGGDAPENDGEAILHALKLVPDAREVILLADNHTFPRDTELLRQVGAGVKVHIILCGATGYLNAGYLQLARAHGYTLHTLEADLLNLSTLLEGQTITVQGAQYLLTKDGFKLVKVL